METLKRVLTVMVVTLIVVIVVGGLYTFGMGNMNHGKGGQMDMTTSQNQGQDGSSQNQNAANPGKTGNQSSGQQSSSTDQQVLAANPQQNQTGQSSQEPSKDGKDAMDSDQQKEPNNQQPPGSPQQSNTQIPYLAGAPIILQAPPSEPKTDPRLYVEQLREKIKEIDNANSQIASNTSSGTMVMQPNGSSVSADQSNMNELHQGFYKLGQNVSSMEQTLDSLSKSVQDQYPGQPQTYNLYGYPQNLSPNYFQYNPYYPYAPYVNNQMPNAQDQQTNQQGQNQGSQQQMQSGQAADQMADMNSNMQMNQGMQMNNFSLSGLLNVNNLNTVFSLILIVSIILGVIAVIGFINSLFKPRKATQESAQIQ